jgi:hypothetical protein
MSRSPLSTLLAAALLAGCAPVGDFPSLAPRPIEKSTREEATPAAPAEGVADAELLKRTSAIVESGEAGHRAFLAELASARPAIERASGASAGGEAWVAAQQAYTAVDAARGTLLAALADLDALRREQVESATPDNQAALDAASQRLATLDAEENAALAELAAKLG